MTEKTEDLIAEAREACEMQYFKGTYQALLMERLADALVAAQGAAPQDSERILLRHPDGTPKSNDEIRSEAAAMREGAAPQAERPGRQELGQTIRNKFNEARGRSGVDPWALADLILEEHPALATPVLPSSGVDEVWRGRIVTASFENGVSRADCGLEDCECPEHEQPPIPAGTYVTVRLDKDERVGLTDVEIRVLAGKEESDE